jgi:hypothetical protein
LYASINPDRQTADHQNFRLEAISPCSMGATILGSGKRRSEGYAMNADQFSDFEPRRPKQIWQSAGSSRIPSAAYTNPDIYQ